MTKNHKSLARKFESYRSLVFKELHNSEDFKRSLVDLSKTDPILRVKVEGVEKSCGCKLSGVSAFEDFLQSYNMKSGDIYYSHLVGMLRSGFKLDAGENGEDKG